MPWRQEPKKGAVHCDKPRVAVCRRLSGDARMGKPAQAQPWAPAAESIGGRGERGELKHLSTLRKRDYSPSSGERKGSSPNLHGFGYAGVVGPDAARQGVTNPVSSRTALERPTTAGDSPVDERIRTPSVFLSTTGHANPVGIREAHLPRLNTLGDR